MNIGKYITIIIMQKIHTRHKKIKKEKEKRFKLQKNCVLKTFLNTFWDKVVEYIFVQSERKVNKKHF